VNDLVVVLFYLVGFFVDGVFDLVGEVKAEANEVLELDID
jgi:hypothetical protein